MLALAILVPLVFLAGLIARRTVPVMPADTGLTTPTPR
jgi:hypothetical protein